MNKMYLFSLLMLLLSCFNCQSQELSGNYSCIIDSLNRIQPKAIQKTKAVGRPYVIKVRNQEQFDHINEKLLAAIEEGRTNIVIKIASGTFHFHENHINLKGFEKGNVSIIIEGKNTIVSSDDDFSEDGYSITPWTDLIQADDTIEVVDKEKKVCMVPYKNSIENVGDNSYNKIQITQSFRAPTYSIEKIDHNGIYFIAEGLEYLNQLRRKGYNVNYDYLAGGETPRFRLYDKGKERPCLVSCFLSISDVSLMSFTLNGICFKSNKEGTALITMTSVDALNVSVRKCSFDNIKSKVATFIGTGNVCFDKNEIIKTAGNELSFFGDCKNVRVTNNVFKDCGTGLGNTMCVRCNGGEYYIANNVFCNFGYCAIGVGLWYGHEKKHDIRGIIEHNEIYFTNDYFSRKEKYTLMDAGAIYVWTQNDDAIIRYNYIHDYGGMRFNSGIYCDDGASNCKIYGNVVLNTPDGCSITSRKVQDQKTSFKNNSNNFMAGNVVDGAVVFEGYGDEERHCVKGANYVVRGEKLVENKLENLEEVQPDIEIYDVKEIRKLRAFKWFKKY